MNFFLLSKSYNGAWWFLQTYVILVLLSPLIIKCVYRNNSGMIFLFSGIIYFISFVVSVKGIFSDTNNEFINILYSSLNNFLSCQFSFVIGVIFVKEKIISKIRQKSTNIKNLQLVGYISIILIIALNVVVENYIIDPITAVLIICTFSIMKISKVIVNMLEYLSKHSTNIWLTHMFLYMSFFSKLVYAPKYDILIFIWLIVLCLITSYIINLIYNPIMKLWNNRQKTYNARLLNE